MRRLIPSAALLVFFGLLFTLATSTVLASKTGIGSQLRTDFLATGYTPRLGVIAPSASVAGSHTWNTDADFAGGTAQNTTVLTDSVRLAGQWLQRSRVNDDVNGTSQEQPALAVGSDGTLYAVWRDMRDYADFQIYFTKSTNDGDTWSNNVRISDTTYGNQSNPEIAVAADGMLYVVWADYRNAGNTPDIYFSKSSDGGVTWSANRKVNDDTGTASQLNPSLLVGSNGYLYLAWEDQRNNDNDIYFSASSDNGTTWSANTKINDDASIAYQSAPNLAIGGSGTLYAVWQDQRSGYNRIYVSSSSNNGATWSANQQVYDDPYSYNNQMWPRLTASGNSTLYLSWTDERDAMDIGLYFATSTDGGQNWTPNLLVNHSMAAEWFAPDINVTSDGTIHVVWSNGQIFYYKSTNGGITWSNPVQVDDGSNGMKRSPRLAVSSANKLYAIWQDDRNGNGDIYTALSGSGTYSTIQDAGDLVKWKSLAWTKTQPAGTAITLSLRVGNTTTPDAHWSNWTTLSASPASLAALPPARYAQWRAELSTNNSGVTPSLDSVTLDWDAFNSTPKSGVLNANTTWSAAGSPYIIEGTLVVAQNVTLALEPGAELWFQDQARLQVRGTLVALGTSAQPIILTSWHVNGQPGDWRGVVFESTAIPATLGSDDSYISGSVLKHTNIENAGYGSRYAVDAIGTALLIDHSTIRNNGSGGLRSQGGLISNNLVAGNVMTITADMNGMGISNAGGGRIEGNTVRENHIAAENQSYSVYGVGIYSSGGGLVSGNLLEQNRAENLSGAYGGGIYASSSTVENNIVRGNDLHQVNSAYGGGIAVDGAVLVTGNTVHTNTVSAQYTTYGGGLYSSNNNMPRAIAVSGSTILANVFDSNSVASQYESAYGGGIYATGANVENNQILNNSSSHVAGGVYGNGGSELRNNRIEGNSATEAGGVFIDNGLVTGNQIVDNHADNTGGALHWQGDGTMSYNTVTSNTTSGHTGGVWVDSGLPRIYANTFISNDSYGSVQK